MTTMSQSPDLDNIPSKVIGFIKAETAREKQVLPIAILPGSVLRVGTIDSGDVALQDELRRSVSGTGITNIQLSRLPEEQLRRLIEKYYPAAASDDLEKALEGLERPGAPVWGEAPSFGPGERLGV